MRAMRSGLAWMAAALVGWATIASAGQPLETETARLLRRGGIKFEGGFERQSSKDGTEAAVPMALEYGVTDRLELLVEPVLYSAIHDKGARRVNGFGDVEVTLTGLLARERPGLPALAVAGEAKLPTAKSDRIGSGEADYAVYLIGSKRVGLWDTHANVAYAFIGRPPGVQVDNVFSFFLAEELHASPRWDVVGELFTSTAALKESADETTPGTNESRLTPEIGGAETVGTLGVRFHPAGTLVYSLGISLDNNNAVLVHPGIAIGW